MNEPTPAPPPDAEAAPYRSLSGLAVAGLILSGLFTGWLVVTAIVALRTGTPLLIQPVWLLVPAAGAVVSALGWLQVHRSEGSRVGVRPAQWGLLLGVLSALSYAVWYAMTELPLRLQAREFTDSWFDDLRQSRQDDRFGYMAFWCSLHPLRRDASFGDLSNPGDRDALVENSKFEEFQKSLRARYLWGERGRKGPLPLFFDHEVVQLVHQAGTEAEIEPLGIRDWEHIGGSEPGYRVEQAYRVQTPDGTFEISVPVLSLDKERRQWRVLLAETNVVQRDYTPRGRLVAQLRVDSQRFAVDWIKKFNDGNGEVVPLLPPRGQLMTDSPKRLKEVGEEMKALLHLPAKERKMTLRPAQLNPNSTISYEIKMVAGKAKELIFFHPFEAQLGEKYRCEGTIAVATTEPSLVRLDDNAGTISEGTSAARAKRWGVIGLLLLRGSELTTDRR